MSDQEGETTHLVDDIRGGSARGGGAASVAGDEHDWRTAGNGSIFFDNRTFSSLEEMRGSLLESCCPGDGVLSGALGLVTTACTPTMLSLPLAFVVGGWSFAILCVLFCVIVAFLSVRILALASLSADSDDYETVAGFFLGAKGCWVIRFILFFYSFGCAVVYLNFIKDSVTPVLVGRASFLPDWMRSDTGGSICLIASMLIITPLTFNSRLASLRTKGLVSNIFTVFIIFTIAYRFFVPQTVPGGAKTHPTKDASASANTDFSTGRLAVALPYMFSAPIFVFSYEVQSNVMAVIKDLHDRTGRKILVSTSLALGVVSIFYVALGILGSLTFPRLSNGNILSNYNVETDLLMMVCQLMCCFSAAVSFVFCIFPCRLAAFMFLSGGGGTKIPKRTRTKLGVVLSALCCILAIFLPDVAKVVSVLGALFSATLSMTFPALFAMKMRSSGTYLTGWVDALLSWGLLFMGLLFSAIGTYMAFVFSS
ncbi:putative mitochondrial amino acid permease aap11ld-like protein (AAT29) [Leptomonas pyrrhocoris]|uniref:Putative mitochondrial amino acid permease aap11ld-like protein (AAT29) n=1 Tax=Leptomonas pyrrhocoris TaxID=157538 RepID=A0A0N0DWJ5_LEPPY|nr:putative mitochondrial amino acid permease aap11ld-like protein (AAT29) [Leptomonas pyrrhocoris]KPA81895.1 putative mitochondrial amino acid permease aap11ld-like protein (AAT29) [Leptomonas pyrrhocoris]|eukprot:XP_015660334.1 putative mitochondrial amino acid permease aap11ld-like protein (AAT29) [Leptomonas pyrrhocoris]